MASPPSGKEGWLKAGVVGAPICVIVICLFTYHLPLRGLLLPEGGEWSYSILYRIHVILRKCAPKFSFTFILLPNRILPNRLAISEKNAKFAT